ncbi:MAG: hypothetical protein K0R54_5538 [Clostridiaceae bacterium]|jgi:hypothetical protein|nr:hypothetical protein [Clostridiaceae bacterium]
MIKEFRYIYDMNQANFYLQNGQIPVCFGKGGRNDIYIKFKDSEELQKIFKQWMDRKVN